MRDFIITTDTTTDLPDSFYQEHHIGKLPICYNINGTTYGDGREMDPKEFYNSMRGGLMPTTMQVNPETATAIFEGYLKQGLDILHICFSSGLSGSINSVTIAAEELHESYPDQRIVIIDSLAASLGEGLIVYKAVKLKEAGKSLDEIKDWLAKNVLHLCHYFTVDDLNHLYRGGRVSKATAVLGTMINVKPLLHVDNAGKLIPISKVRGRKRSLNALVDYMEKQMGSYKDQNDIVFISHGDALEDAEYVAKQIKDRFGMDNFLINVIGPTIGAHSGPGTIALFFMGEAR